MNSLPYVATFAVSLAGITTQVNGWMSFPEKHRFSTVQRSTGSSRDGQKYNLGINAADTVFSKDMNPLADSNSTRRIALRDDQEFQVLRSALWDEQHFDADDQKPPEKLVDFEDSLDFSPPCPKVFYPDVDLSIPETVYSDDVDLVWDLLRWEAYQQAQREPLLVSFLYSTILNHDSLESSLAFLLANRLASTAMMISTQLQSIILDTLRSSPVFRRSLRADIMAVRDRDPACNYLPDVFLYFKGFHALQSHRAAHCLWKAEKQVLALFLQSQVSQIFQIDIHPNATLESGVLIDHGTGVVIGSTVRDPSFPLSCVLRLTLVLMPFVQASVGHNCSILHHVTLGGSGKKGVDRHPKIGNGVLLGAGATVLGPVRIGEGCQIGAGTLVIADLPARSVAVGVPARIIGSFVDVTPSLSMNQLLEVESGGI